MISEDAGISVVIHVSNNRAIGEQNISIITIHFEVFVTSQLTPNLLRNATNTA